MGNGYIGRCVQKNERFPKTPFPPQIRLLWLIYGPVKAVAANMKCPAG